GNLAPAFTIFNQYRRRQAERLIFAIKLVERGVENVPMNVEEALEIDREKAPWPVDAAELNELWRKRIKNEILTLKLAGKPMKDIGDLLDRRYRGRLHRLSQMDREDAFLSFTNVWTEVHDPHAQYYSPRMVENFNIHMSLSLEGIGALLQIEDEYTKVLRLIPAGPAEKAGELKPGDRIVGVGQDTNGEIVDVVGWRLDDVVNLIRGPKETVVRLEIIPADAPDESTRKIYAITRNTVKLEEQAAQKKVKTLNRGGRDVKVGVIEIPAFYIDFDAMRKGDPEYKSTTRDVGRLLKELAAEGVDGVVIDLRDNGGGALQEASELTGLFIRSGPTVQVRGARGDVERLKDEDGKIAYDGPLVVLVNRLSASASEIFTGAIQDYGRGVVVGGRTFGKGTVQSLRRLKQGQLKYTVAKFYRVSGKGAQYRGVLQDILFPAVYNKDEIGESALPNAFPWD
ncbi:MAG: tail-specific protease, partial [Desulfobacterales bacterium]|nr:tail-specific protease [Desulfobacterales bacterium]